MVYGLASKHFISRLYPFQLRAVSTTVSGCDRLVIQLTGKVSVLSAGGIVAKEPCACFCSNLGTHVSLIVACISPCSLTKNISEHRLVYHIQVFSIR